MSNRLKAAQSAAIIVVALKRAFKKSEGCPLPTVSKMILKAASCQQIVISAEDCYRQQSFLRS